MKKDKLFTLLQEYIYGLEPAGPRMGKHLANIGVDVDDLWVQVDALLMVIAEKHGED